MAGGQLGSEGEQLLFPITCPSLAESERAKRACIRAEELWEIVFQTIL